MKARWMLCAGTLGAMISMMSSSAFAQGQEGGAGAAPATGLRAEAQFEVLPMGSGKTTFEGQSVTADTATAYGITGIVDYAINPYLSIGVAPRLVLNVKSTDAGDDTDASKEIDLRARITGRVPVAPGVELYASVMPGYSIVTSTQDGMNSATGFALAGALGATYDLTPRFFLGAEVGYQHAFTSVDQMVGNQKLSADLDLSYLHVGIGAGTRF
jgi:opacity protein-like surface antigen